MSFVVCLERVEVYACITSLYAGTLELQALLKKNLDFVMDGVSSGRLHTIAHDYTPFCTPLHTITHHYTGRYGCALT